MLKKLRTGKSGREKGFYIVLFLCAAVLGTSSWIALAGTKTDVEEETAAEVFVPYVAPEENMSLPVMAEIEMPEPEAELTAAPASVIYESPVEGGVQKPYSVETLMYDVTMQDWRTHAGVDYACAEGTAVVAAADGTVEAVYKDPLLGITVAVTHPDGVQTLYSNLTGAVSVQSGDAVTRGQILGSVGTTAIGESADAAHLHFAMSKNGMPLDPADYLE